LLLHSTGIGQETKNYGMVVSCRLYIVWEQCCLAARFMEVIINIIWEVISASTPTFNVVDGIYTIHNKCFVYYLQASRSFFLKFIVQNLAEYCNFLSVTLQFTNHCHNCVSPFFYQGHCCAWYCLISQYNGGQIQLHSYSVVTRFFSEGYMRTIRFCLLQQEAYTWHSKINCQCSGWWLLLWIVMKEGISLFTLEFLNNSSYKNKKKFSHDTWTLKKASWICLVCFFA
jgi:hypothetical protein